MNKLFFSFLVMVAFTAQMFAQTVTVTVSANNATWVNTGISKTATNSISICAGGQATVWPGVPGCQWSSPAGLGRTTNGCTSCNCPSCPVVSLIGKIGTTGTPFFVGDNAYLTGSSPTGTLYLLVNDQSTLYTDNSGSFTATVTVGCVNCGGTAAALSAPDNNVVQPDPTATEINGSIDFENGSVGVFPNPAQGSFNLYVTLNEESDVTVVLMDIMGRHLETVVDGKYPTGTVDFSTKVPDQVGSGFMLVQTTINGETQIQKIATIK